MKREVLESLAAARECVWSWLSVQPLHAAATHQGEQALKSLDVTIGLLELLWVDECGWVKDDEQGAAKK